MPSTVPEPYAATQARARSNARLAVRGIGLNAVLAVVKIAGGVLGHAYALIADGVESALDVATSLLVWTGVRVAGEPPDADHPYGHGRAEPLAAMAVAGVTLVAACWIAVNAVHLIVTPHPTPHWATLLLAAGAALAKARLSKRLRLAGETSGSIAMGTEAWHQRSDAIVSAAAFVGIAIAVAGGRGWEAADDWAALFACGIVSAGSIARLRAALGEIMDTAVPKGVENDIRKIASAIPGVEGLDKVRVRKSGLTHLVDIQIRVGGDLTVREGHKLAHAVKDALIASPLRITDVSVHVEPEARN